MPVPPTTPNFRTENRASPAALPILCGLVLALLGGCTLNPIPPLSVTCLSGFVPKEIQDNVVCVSTEEREARFTETSFAALSDKEGALSDGSRMFNAVLVLSSNFPLAEPLLSTVAERFEILGIWYLHSGTGTNGYAPFEPRSTIPISERFSNAICSTEARDDSGPEMHQVCESDGGVVTWAIHVRATNPTARSFWLEAPTAVRFILVLDPDRTTFPTPPAPEETLDNVPGIRRVR